VSNYARKAVLMHQRVDGALIDNTRMQIRPPVACSTSIIIQVGTTHIPLLSLWAIVYAACTI